MAVPGSIDVEGINGLLKSLVEMGGNTFAKKELRKAIRAGAKPMLAAVLSHVPVDTGELRESLKLRAIRRTRTGVGIRIGTSQHESAFKGDQFYGAFEELGTAKQPGQPYLRPGFDETKDQSAEIVGDMLGAAVERGFSK